MTRRKEKRSGISKSKQAKATAPSNTDLRRTALLTSNKGESQLELLPQGVLSSSSSTNSSLNELYIQEIKQQKRPELQRGESNTKLLLGFSSSETTGSSITDKSLSSQDKNGIIAKAASLFPVVQRDVVNVKKIKTPDKKKKKKKKKKRHKKLAPVKPPEFIFVPINPEISMTIIGETETIHI